MIEPVTPRLLLRFIVAGGFNTLVHAGIFAVLVVSTSGVPGGWLVAASWVIAMPIAYAVQSRFVWHRPMSAGGLLKLSVSYVPGFLISTGLAVVIDVMGGSYFWQEFVGLGAAAIVGFILQRTWVYRSR